MSALASSSQANSDGLTDLSPPNYWRNLASRLRASAVSQMVNLPAGGLALSNAMHDVRTNRELAEFYDMLADNAERRGG